MRDVGEQRAERDDELRAERLGELDDHPAERAPAERRLVPDEQDQVARRARHAGLVELDRRPHDLARLSVDQLDLRAGRLEVVELLGVDRREPPARRARRPTNVIALEAASAASFQPLNAQISAGARSPSGRYSHCSGCIRLTVHHGGMGPGDSTAVADQRACAPGRRSTACSRARARTA